MEAGLEACRALRRTGRTLPSRASNLSELTLTLGEVERAVAFGKQSVDLADRSGDAFQRMVNRTTLADALHQAGRWEESAEAFREAEALQAERQPQYPRLYSLQGYRYCDLLLSRGEPEDGSVADGLAADPEAARRFREACREVRERAEQTLEWLKSKRLPPRHRPRPPEPGPSPSRPGPDGPPAGGSRRGGGSGFRQGRGAPGPRRGGPAAGGYEDYLPRGLLARAALRRLRGDLPAAEADLSEALEIAERGSMRLHECDAHLEWARLCRQRGDRDGLERHVARARKLVEETGYGRRRREVEWLEGPHPRPLSRPPEHAPPGEGGHHSS